MSSSDCTLCKFPALANRWHACSVGVKVQLVCMSNTFRAAGNEAEYEEHKQLSNMGLKKCGNFTKMTAFLKVMP